MPHDRCHQPATARQNGSWYNATVSAPGTTPPFCSVRATVLQGEMPPFCSVQSTVLQGKMPPFCLAQCHRAPRHDATDRSATGLLARCNGPITIASVKTPPHVTLSIHMNHRCHGVMAGPLTSNEYNNEPLHPKRCKTTRHDNRGGPTSGARSHDWPAVQHPKRCKTTRSHIRNDTKL